MHILVATDSVHTTAAACDYLDSRVTPDDAVTVITISGSDSRDSDDALNVATARLLGHVEVKTERIETKGDVATAILESVAERAPEALIIGKHAGDRNADSSLGSTARTLIEASDVPVVVVPIPT